MQTEMFQPGPNVEMKKELRSILNAIQYSPQYGIYVCEKFKDPRRFVMDDYWNDVCDHAVGIQDVGMTLGRNEFSLTQEARTELGRLATLLASLSNRIVAAIDPQPDMS